MDPSKALRVQTCIKWETEIPRSGCPQESETFNWDGFERFFRLSVNANHPSCFFLYCVTKNPNRVMVPFEMSVYVETPNELKFCSKVSIEDPVYCISMTPKTEMLDMMRQRGWKKIPYVFILPEAGEDGIKARDDDLETLSHDFGKLCNDATNCDVCFYVDDERFYAYKNVLLSRGKKFEEKLFQGFVVRQPPTVIKITGVDKETFREILQYCCSGKLSKTLDTPGFAERLYEAARMYGLDHLAKKCTGSILKSLTPDNVYDILILANKQKHEELEELLISYLFDQKLIGKEGWMDFSEKSGVCDLVKKIYLKFVRVHEACQCMRQVVHENFY